MNIVCVEFKFRYSSRSLEEIKIIDVLCIEYIISNTFRLPILLKIVLIKFVWYTSKFESIKIKVQQVFVKR